MESPENWFEDFGRAQLRRGQAVVNIDPVFAETVSKQYEYHVFVTPKGDCRGLYVASQSATSFEVRELQRGKSTIEFDYRVVAKRKGYERAQPVNPIIDALGLHDIKCRPSRSQFRTQLGSIRIFSRERTDSQNHLLEA
jgi:hypothetical protein